MTATLDDEVADLRRANAALQQRLDERTVELSEALAQQTATAEVLGVINSSSGDLAPVFDAMLDKAMRLCEAAFGILLTFDGETFQTVSFRNVPEGLADYMSEPIRPDPNTTLGKVVRERRTIHTEDNAEAEPYRKRAPLAVAAVELGHVRTVLHVPLIKDETVLGVFIIFRQFVWLVERLGFGHAAVFGAAILLGLVITLYKIEMFWVTRRPIARAILAATGGEPGPVRRAVAASWHWFFIALSLGIFFGSGIELALGKGAWVARAATATQGIVVALAVVGQASHNLIARLCTCDATNIRLTLRRARLHRALSRLSDALVWILGAAWLGETWGLDLVDPEGPFYSRRFPLGLATIPLEGGAHD